MLLRKIDNGEAEPTFPEVWGPAERDAYYSSIAWAGWGGASGSSPSTTTKNSFQPFGRVADPVRGVALCAIGQQDTTR